MSAAAVQRAALRGTALRCTAWCAALAVLAYTPPASAEGEFSRAAACALPFALLAGVPLAPQHADPSAADRAPAWRSAALWLAFALAPLLVAARFDVLAGASLAATTGVCAFAACATFALAWASARANGGGLHAACWFTCALGAPVFAATCALAVAQQARPDWPGTLANVSPLTWLWRAARAPGEPPFDVALLAAAACGLALVLASARVRVRAEVRT